MKLKVLILLLLLIPSILSAQNSYINLMQQSNYKAEFTIIRNYNENYNIVMTYGYDTLLFYLDTVVPQSCDFYLHNINTGTMTHLFNMSGGYRVNDIQFVTLRKQNNMGSEDFCCFCGTKRTILGIIQGHALPDEPPIFIIDDTLNGFAGFFSMSDALNPNNTMSAKVRYVEETERLFKMTCYAEYHGAYYPNQSAFDDNAVLDIIGEPKIPRGNPAPSCVTRVKFYPDFQGSVRWDNNIRFNDTEIMEDIIGTDSYTVTASYIPNDNEVILRNSEKETFLYPGGRQLNSTVYKLEMNTITINGDPSTTVFESPIRLCSIPNSDNAFISFRTINDEVKGISTFKFSFGSTSSMFLLDGAFLEKNNVIRDIMFLPLSNRTSSIMGELGDSTMKAYVTFWGQNYTTDVFSTSNIILQSSCKRELYRSEDLFWSGVTKNISNPSFILKQRILPTYGSDNTCLGVEEYDLDKNTIDHHNDESEYLIKERFPNDLVSYPMYYFFFNTYVVQPSNQCEK
ncbi:MAG: hypothetical protein J6X86_02995 [Bacteroidales bacterium]|nr:hypothetical protein [Bacteroidales bacterium]